MPTQKTASRYTEIERRDLKTIGERLRSLRLSRGFSQEAFADAVGVHRTYIGSVERGEKSIGILKLQKIVQTLQLDTQELFSIFKNSGN